MPQSDQPLQAGVANASPVIRPASVSDAASIARIHVETWRSAYRNIVPAAHLASLSIERRTQGWEKNFRENLSAVLVAEQSGGIVGWVSFGPCRDEGETRHAEIYALYVETARQRAGIGRILLEAAEARLGAAAPAGSIRISLWVLARNFPARRFYERLGYVAGPREKRELIGGEPFAEVRYEKVASNRGPSLGRG